MMSNPFYGVILDGRYYRFEEGSYSRPRELLTRSDLTQERRRAVSTLGLGPITHSVTLILDNNYEVVDFNTNNVIGSTQWLGVSRLYDLEQLVGRLGSSLPFLFSTPYGTTHSVVPKGIMDASIFITNPATPGIEWRVSLSLEDINA